MISVRPLPERQRPALPPILGECVAIRRAVALARRFAPTPAPILVLGPTGTGKELLAQHVHLWSERPGEVVDVNCAAIPRDLLEGLLFGHRRGAFSGAIESAVGLIEAGDGGTLFLDELESLSLEAQAKLLRVLETGEVRRLGETVKRRVDVRIVSAAQDSLSHATVAGRFRRDLYQRVAGVVIELPALSERGDDVVLLARHFAAVRGRVLAPETGPVLRAYPWPGNVRELAAALDRAACLSDDRTLVRDAILEAIALGSPSAAEHEGAGRGRATLHAEARRRLLEVCEAHGWDAARAAAALAISRATLYRRLEEFGISLRAHRRVSQFVLRQAENS